MKATLKYENGYLIEIPSKGSAPMLFMEWISEFPSGKNPIQKIIDGDNFKVRLNQKKVDLQKCVDYINSNI